MRDRAWRRAQSEKRKAKHKRDWIAKTTGSGSSNAMPNVIDDSRHPLDCGHRCFMCHGDKLIEGRRPERRLAKLQIKIGAVVEPRLYRK